MVARRSEQPFEDLLSVKEAGQLLQVSESTLWRWINQKRLPAYRVGPRRMRLRKRDLEPIIAPARSPLLEDKAKADIEKYAVPLGAGDVTPEEIETWWRNSRPSLRKQRGWASR